MLKEFHALYGDNGFPNPSEISIRRREHTGGGRYVELATARSTSCPDGYLDLGGKFISIEGVPNGMMAVVLIARGRPSILEITVYGGDAWDGRETEWALK